MAARKLFFCSGESSDLASSARRLAPPRVNISMDDMDEIELCGIVNI